MVKHALRGWALAMALLFAAAPVQAANDPANTLVMELRTGKVLIKLMPDLAPKHVARVKELARAKFYDGIVFHRVIADFMAQTGDPTGTGTGTGGSGRGNLPAEYSRYVFKRGTVGAARTQDPDSADSQFFICFGRGCQGLTGEYTVWGQVVSGMEHVDQVNKGEPPATPDKILRMYIEADRRR